MFFIIFVMLIRHEMERYQQLLYEQQLRMHQNGHGLYSNGALVRNSPVRTSMGPSPTMNRTFPPPNHLPIMRRSYSLNAEQVKAARKINGAGGMTSPKRVSFSTLPSPPSHPGQNRMMSPMSPNKMSPMSPTRLLAISPSKLYPASPNRFYPSSPNKVAPAPNRNVPVSASNKVAPLVNGYARQNRPMSSDSVFFNKPLPPVPEARTWLLGGGKRLVPKAPESESGSEAGEIQRILFSGRGSNGGAPSYVSFRGEYLDGVVVFFRGAALIFNARHTPIARNTYQSVCCSEAGVNYQ